jgi:hypothetical protein
MFAIAFLLMTAVSARAEIRRAEMTVFGMD